MKSVDRSKLPRNSLLSIFQYIVLIMAFVVVGMIRDDKVVFASYTRNNCSGSHSGVVGCYDNTGVDSNGIRLDVKFSDHAGFNFVNILLCTKDKNNCYGEERLYSADNKKERIRVFDVYIYRSGVVKYHYMDQLLI